jgi:hypothetical protein
MKKLIVVIASVVLFSAWANASTISTFGGASDHTVSNWIAEGQQFLPAGNVLSDVTIQIEARETPGFLGFSVYQWAGNSAIGPALYTTTANWSNAGLITFSNINLALTPGTLYAFFFDNFHYNNGSLHYTSNSYAGGKAMLSESSSPNSMVVLGLNDLTFKADFDVPPPATAVPEPASLMLLASGLPFVLRRLRRK